MPAWVFPTRIEVLRVKVDTEWTSTGLLCECGVGCFVQWDLGGDVLGGQNWCTASRFFHVKTAVGNQRYRSAAQNWKLCALVESFGIFDF